MNVFQELKARGFCYQATDETAVEKLLTEGKIAFKLWFGLAGNFNNGFAKVELNGKWYNLDKEGNLTLAESRRASSPVITESILKRIKSECIKRLIAIK